MRIPLLCAATLLLLVAMATLCEAGVPASQRQALEDLFDSNGGSQWNKRAGWKVSGDVCSWYGVDCTNNVTVTQLDLDGNNLVGKFPTNLLQRLPDLTSLSLSYNKMDGDLPDVFAHQKLATLVLSSNMFTGLVPKSLGSAPLEIVDLSLNRFVLPLPIELTKLNNTLLSFSLESNGLDGALQSEILKTWTKVQSLSFANNALVGTIVGMNERDQPGDPDLWKYLPELTHLSLNNNKFSGGLSALNVQENNLIFLSLSYNPFQSAELDEVTWSKFTNLRTLFLENCNLFGKYPNSLSTLTGLKNLRLNNNGITGPLPADLIQQAQNNPLSELHLANNFLSGPIDPTMVGAVTREVDLHNNSFACPMPKVTPKSKFTRVNLGDCKCALGQQGNNTNKCEACPLGTYGNQTGGPAGVGGGMCAACSANTYSSVNGATECVACPALHSSEPGAAVCQGGPLAGVVIGSLAGIGAIAGAMFVRDKSKKRMLEANRVMKQGLLDDMRHDNEELMSEPSSGDHDERV